MNKFNWWKKFLFVGMTMSLTPEEELAAKKQLEQDAKKKRMWDKAKEMGKDIGSFVLLGGGAAILAGIIGFSAKKGVQYADRSRTPGTDTDDTMTTAQAGQRGGRQRAA
jgi:hypothetical protein